MTKNPQGNEEKFRLLYENLPLGYQSLDLQGNLIIVNKAWLDLLGYSRKEEVIGVNFGDFITEKNLFAERFPKFKQCGITHEALFEMIRKDGSHILVAIDGRVSYNKNGDFIQTHCVLQDITEKREAEEEFQKFKFLSDNSNDAHFLINRDTRFLYVNKTACKMMGYSKDEFLTLSVPDVDTVYDKSKFHELFDLIQKETMSQIETINKRKDGTTFPSEITVTGYRIGGKPYMFAALRDITERKIMEEELLQAQKMESIGILAGGIAHDFNNLLSGILTNIYISKMDIDRESKEYKCLESAEKAINSATSLTRQLLTFSRGGTPIKQAASIIEIIKESAIFALRGSNVKCEYNVIENLWPVEVDGGQINQAIHNIILNAVQSMPEGGTIRISVENSALRSGTGLPLEEGRYLKIAIHDQGLGIEKEHLQKVFDPYFTTKEMGRGLGLSITYSIIKQHDGHIFAESELGTGTTSTIYLPATEKELVEKKPVEDTIVAGDGKILLMDDEKIIRESVEEFLTISGFEVECAKEGEEAIELYKKAMETSKPFDVVILDLTIRGGMGGKETVKKLLEINPDVKAIVSSGYSNDPVMANFKEYGFSDVFCKASNNPDDLCRILRWAQFSGQQSE